MALMGRTARTKRRVPEDELFQASRARQGEAPRWFRITTRERLTKYLMVGSASGIGGMNDQIEDAVIHRRQVAMIEVLSRLLRAQPKQNRQPLTQQPEYGQLLDELLRVAKSTYQSGSPSAIAYALYSPECGTGESLAAEAGRRVTSVVDSGLEPTRQTAAKLGELSDAVDINVPPSPAIWFHPEKHRDAHVHRHVSSVNFAASGKSLFNGTYNTFGLLRRGEFRDGMFPAQRHFAYRDHNGHLRFSYALVVFGIVQPRNIDERQRVGDLHDVDFGITDQLRIAAMTARTVRYTDWVSAIASDLRRSIKCWAGNQEHLGADEVATIGLDPLTSDRKAGHSRQVTERKSDTGHPQTQRARKRSEGAASTDLVAPVVDRALERAKAEYSRLTLPDRKTLLLELVADSPKAVQRELRAVLSNEKMHQPDTKDLATVTSAAEILRINKRSLQKQINTGRVTVFELADGRELVSVSQCRTIWPDGPRPSGLHLK